MSQEKIVPVVRRIFKFWNQLEVDVSTFPEKGPAIFYFNHTSTLDILLLMTADPYTPQAAFPAKVELFNIPLYGKFLRSMGAIPVARNGNDAAAIREMSRVINQNRTLCIAVEGTRSPDGRIQPFDQAAVAFIARMAQRGVPVYPLVIKGACDVMPRGSWFPGRGKIEILAGERILFNFSPTASKEDKVLAAASQMRQSLVGLLPPRYHPQTQNLLKPPS